MRHLSKLSFAACALVACTVDSDPNQDAASEARMQRNPTPTAFREAGPSLDGGPAVPDAPSLAPATDAESDAQLAAPTDRSAGEPGDHGSTPSEEDGPPGNPDTMDSVSVTVVDAPFQSGNMGGTTTCVGDGNVVVGNGSVNATFDLSDADDSGCTSSGGEGSDTARDAVDETRAVEPFDGVELTDDLQGELSVGPPRVMLDLDADTLSKVKTWVDEGVLHIGDDDPAPLRSHAEDRVRVDAPNLRSVAAVDAASWSGEVESDALELAALGASSLDLEVNVADTLRLEASGTSRTLLAGSARQLLVDAAGTSRVESSVPASVVEVTAVGASSVKVHATQRVVVNAAGTSRVEVSGNPPEREVSEALTSHVVFVP